MLKPEMDTAEPLLTTEDSSKKPDPESMESGNAKGLEVTLERIGFGAYQWRLLVLCGLGWMSDNATLQCVAIILPRVQVHFALSSTIASLLSASTMAGMMVGAVTWGALSDILGRAIPFNATLLLTAVFGLLASFVSDRFWLLCFWMFWLGTAVGGSMPTDGTLFLENLPESKQYMLTLLSVFFSLGAVLSASIGYIVLPSASCPAAAECDFSSGQNDGWRRMLLILGLVNLTMFVARFALFRLYEPARYLVSKQRSGEALDVLKNIANFNDNTILLDLEDVETRSSCIEYRTIKMEDGNASEYRTPLETPTPTIYTGRTKSRPGINSSSSSAYLDYSTAREYGTPPPAEGSRGSSPPHTMRSTQGSVFHTPSEELSQARSFRLEHAQTEQSTLAVGSTADVELSGRPSAEELTLDDIDSITETTHRSYAVRTLLDKGIDRVHLLFVSQWRKTTILMWLVWGLMSLAYGMFNVWLPTVLEQRSTGTTQEGLHHALKEYLLYSLAGCPGSLIGAWSIESRLGRRRSLALFTLATATAMFAFIAVTEEWAVLASSMLISLAGTAMYAVLYGMTPEIFSIDIRGTACGTSAAISRLTGIIAPVLAGMLLAIAPSLALIASAAIFATTAACALLLPFEKSPDIAKGGRFKAMRVEH